MSNDSLVLVDTDSRGVATVTLNRPEVNNAYNAELVQALGDVFDELGKDASVRIVVIRGNGPHFQAGADLKWLRQVGTLNAKENLTTSYRTASLVRTLDEFPVPTIALIHGACIGGGTGIACACDLVIASDDATFAISEARWGAIASIILPQLNAAIGVRNVRRYAITCEKFGAIKAQTMGLVHEIAPLGKLDEVAEPLIDAILKCGPKAVSATKYWSQRAGERLDDEMFDMLVDVHANCRQSEEASEGFASFIEKRDASWYVPKEVE